ncbi:serine/threonine-protein kinase [Actinomadura madurae]|uniref:serine/threonine-protein kinase n=2 Tax=Actinomadura madurae TaxID=1993 RepID=UPI002025CAB5|nr:serine/threonine-protein kinase [Actinomadura madurae]URM98170.1 serine/threonine-protein kinase [Actinomadura madurae]
MEPLRPGDPRRLAQFEVLARLGRGGMGEVFLGTSPGGRPVAIKLIHRELADDPGFRARFRRETEIARTVSGVFTAPVLRADPDAERPWLATAYLPGLSLEEAVGSHGPLPPAAVRGLAVGLAEAVRSIHRAGVVHRDLKPANVLLGPDGARVIDFGIARAADSAAITQSGEVIGSAGYLAPEHIAHGTAGPASDVFSLGAVLVFACTGTGPFGDGSVHRILHRTVHEPPRLEAVPDPVLRDIAAACLAKDPAERPAPDQVTERLTDAATMDLHGTRWLPHQVVAAIGARGREPVPPPLPVHRRRRIPRRVLVAGGAVGAVAAFLAIDDMRTRPASPPGPVRWMVRLPGDRVRREHGLVIVDGMLLVVGGTAFAAVDPRAGRVRWSVPDVLTDTVEGLAWSADRLFLRLADGRLAAYHLATGREAWSHRLGLTSSSPPPAVAGGAVCVPVPGENKLTAFDARTGRARWSHGRLSAHGPVASGRTVCHPDADDLLAGIDAVTGRRRWSAELSRPPVMPLQKAGDLILAVTGAPGTRSPTVLAFTAADGRPRWQAELAAPASEHGMLTLADDRTVYMVWSAGVLHALDRRTGRLRWTYPLGAVRDSVDPPPMIVAPGRLFVNTRNGLLVAVDTAGGRGLWRQRLHPDSHGGPVLADGLLHIGDRGLSSFDPATGRLVRRIGADHRSRPIHPENLCASGGTLYHANIHGELLATPTRS